MSRFATPYPIGRSTHLCAATARALAEGERCMSVIMEGEGEGQLQRLNYSMEAWERGARPDKAAGRIIGVWKATITLGDHKPKAVLDEESLLDLLQQIEPGDPKRDAVRLVLAMLLLRTRALVQDGSVRGKLLLRARGVPRPPEGPPPIEVSDTGLDEATINDVMSELEPLLGLPTAQPPQAGETPQVQMAPGVGSNQKTGSAGAQA